MKLAILFAVLFSATAFAQGSSGGGNGGFAVKLSTKEVVPVDIIDQITGQIIPIRNISTRTELFSLVKKQLKHNKLLLSRLLAQLNSDGEYEKWQVGEYYLTTDRFFDANLPASAELLQVAIRNGKSLVRTNAEISDPRFRRVIELHEALYQVGVEYYRHTNPILTRTVTASLVSPTTESKKMKQLLIAFEAITALYPANHLGIQNTHLQGAFFNHQNSTVSLPWNQDDQRRHQYAEHVCPSALVLDYDGLGGLHLTMKTPWGIHFTRYHRGTKLIPQKVMKIRKPDGSLRHFQFAWATGFGLKPLLDIRGNDTLTQPTEVVVCGYEKADHIDLRQALQWIVEQSENSNK